MRGQCLAGVGVHHLLHIAVVGSDQALAVCLAQRFYQASYALVQSLHCLDGSVKVAAMTHHVAVGVVADNRVVTSVTNRLLQLVGDFVCAHFGLQVVGCNLRRRHQDAVFTVIGLLASAAEKERHVGVFFGLGDAQLSAAQSRQVLA